MTDTSHGSDRHARRRADHHAEPAGQASTRCRRDAGATRRGAAGRRARRRRARHRARPAPARAFARAPTSPSSTPATSRSTRASTATALQSARSLRMRSHRKAAPGGDQRRRRRRGAEPGAGVRPALSPPSRRAWSWRSCDRPGAGRRLAVLPAAAGRPGAKRSRWPGRATRRRRGGLRAGHGEQGAARRPGAGAHAGSSPRASPAARRKTLGADQTRRQPVARAAARARARDGSRLPDASPPGDPNFAEGVAAFREKRARFTLRAARSRPPWRTC